MADITIKSSPLLRLHAVIAAVCPIIGVSVGIIGDSSTVKIEFDPKATPQQMADAQNLVDTFDWSLRANADYQTALTIKAAGDLLTAIDSPHAFALQAIFKTAGFTADQVKLNLPPSPIILPQVGP